MPEPIARAYVELKARGAEEVISAFESIKSQALKIGAAFLGLQKAFSLTRDAVMETERATVLLAGEFETTYEQAHQYVRALDELRVAWGYTREEAAFALAQITDAGFETAQAMGMVDDAMQLARATGADLGKVAQVLSSIMAAFGLSTEEVSRAANVMFKIMSAGRATLEDLDLGFFRLILMAKPLGVSLEELGAAYTVMTMKTSELYNVYLALHGVMKAMIRPTDALSALVKEMGFASAEAAFRQMGLIKFMQLMVRAVREGRLQIGDLITDLRAVTGIMAITEQDTERMLAMFEEMTGGFSGLSQAARAFQESMMGIIRTLTEEFKLLVLEIAPPLLGFLKEVLSALRSLVGAARDVFGVFKEVGRVLLAPFVQVQVEAGKVEGVKDAYAEMTAELSRIFTGSVLAAILAALVGKVAPAMKIPVFLSLFLSLSFRAMLDQATLSSAAYRLAEAVTTILVLAFAPLGLKWVFAAGAIKAATHVAFKVYSYVTAARPEIDWTPFREKIRTLEDEARKALREEAARLQITFRIQPEALIERFPLVSPAHWAEEASRFARALNEALRVAYKEIGVPTLKEPEKWIAIGEGIMNELKKRGFQAASDIITGFAAMAREGFGVVIRDAEGKLRGVALEALAPLFWKGAAQGLGMGWEEFKQALAAEGFVIEERIAGPAVAGATQAVDALLAGIQEVGKALGEAASKFGETLEAKLLRAFWAAQEQGETIATVLARMWEEVVGAAAKAPLEAPARIEEFFEGLNRLIERLSKTVGEVQVEALPEELRGTFQRLASLYTELAAALKHFQGSIRETPGPLERLREAIASETLPPLQQALYELVHQAMLTADPVATFRRSIYELVSSVNMTPPAMAALAGVLADFESLLEREAQGWSRVLGVGRSRAAEMLEVVRGASHQVGKSLHTLLTEAKLPALQQALLDLALRAVKTKDPLAFFQMEVLKTASAFKECPAALVALQEAFSGLVSIFDRAGPIWERTLGEMPPKLNEAITLIRTFSESLVAAGKTISDFLREAKFPDFQQRLVDLAFQAAKTTDPLAFFKAELAKNVETLRTSPPALLALLDAVAALASAFARLPAGFEVFLREQELSPELVKTIELFRALQLELDQASQDTRTFATALAEIKLPELQQYLFTLALRALETADPLTTFRNLLFENNEILRTSPAAIVALLDALTGLPETLERAAQGHAFLLREAQPAWQGAALLLRDFQASLAGTTQGLRAFLVEARLPDLQQQLWNLALKALETADPIATFRSYLLEQLDVLKASPAAVNALIEALRGLFSTTEQASSGLGNLLRETVPEWEQVIALLREFQPAMAEATRTISDFLREAKFPDLQQKLFELALEAVKTKDPLTYFRVGLLHALESIEKTPAAIMALLDAVRGLGTTLEKAPEAYEFILGEVPPELLLVVELLQAFQPAVEEAKEEVKTFADVLREAKLPDLQQFIYDFALQAARAADPLATFHGLLLQNADILRGSPAALVALVDAFGGLKDTLKRASLAHKALFGELSPEIEGAIRVLEEFQKTVLDAAKGLAGFLETAELPELQQYLFELALRALETADPLAYFRAELAKSADILKESPAAATTLFDALTGLGGALTRAGEALKAILGEVPPRIAGVIEMFGRLQSEMARAAKGFGDLLKEAKLPELQQFLLEMALAAAETKDPFVTLRAKLALFGETLRESPAALLTLLSTIEGLSGSLERAIPAFGLFGVQLPPGILAVADALARLKKESEGAASRLKQLGVIGELIGIIQLATNRFAALREAMYRHGRALEAQKKALEEAARGSVEALDKQAKASDQAARKIQAIPAPPPPEVPKKPRLPPLDPKVVAELLEKFREAAKKAKEATKGTEEAAKKAEETAKKAEETAKTMEQAAAKTAETTQALDGVKQAITETSSALGEGAAKLAPATTNMVGAIVAISEALGKLATRVGETQLTLEGFLPEVPEIKPPVLDPAIVAFELAVEAARAKIEEFAGLTLRLHESSMLAQMSFLDLNDAALKAMMNLLGLGEVPPPVLITDKDVAGLQAAITQASTTITNLQNALWQMQDVGTQSTSALQELARAALETGAKLLAIPPFPEIKLPPLDELSASIGLLQNTIHTLLTTLEGAKVSFTGLFEIGSSLRTSFLDLNTAASLIPLTLQGFTEALQIKPPTLDPVLAGLELALQDSVEALRQSISSLGRLTEGASNLGGSFSNLVTASGALGTAFGKLAEIPPPPEPHPILQAIEAVLDFFGLSITASAQTLRELEASGFQVRQSFSDIASSAASASSALGKIAAIPIAAPALEPAVSAIQAALGRASEALSLTETGFTQLQEATTKSQGALSLLATSALEAQTALTEIKPPEIPLPDLMPAIAAMTTAVEAVQAKLTGYEAGLKQVQVSSLETASSVLSLGQAASDVSFALQNIPPLATVLLPPLEGSLAGFQLATQGFSDLLRTTQTSLFAFQEVSLGTGQALTQLEARASEAGTTLASFSEKLVLPELAPQFAELGVAVGTASTALEGTKLSFTALGGAATEGRTSLLELSGSFTQAQSAALHFAEAAKIEPPDFEPVVAAFDGAIHEANASLDSLEAALHSTQEAGTGAGAALDTLTSGALKATQALLDIPPLGPVLMAALTPAIAALQGAIGQVQAAISGVQSAFLAFQDMSAKAQRSFLELSEAAQKPRLTLQEIPKPAEVAPPILDPAVVALNLAIEETRTSVEAFQASVREAREANLETQEALSSLSHAASQAGVALRDLPVLPEEVPELGLMAEGFESAVKQVQGVSEALQTGIAQVQKGSVEAQAALAKTTEAAKGVAQAFQEVPKAVADAGLVMVDEVIEPLKEIPQAIAQTGETAIDKTAQAMQETAKTVVETSQAVAREATSALQAVPQVAEQAGAVVEKAGAAIQAVKPPPLDVARAGQILAEMTPIADAFMGSLAGCQRAATDAGKGFRVVCDAAGKCRLVFEEVAEAAKPEEVKPALEPAIEALSGAVDKAKAAVGGVEDVAAKFEAAGGKATGCIMDMAASVAPLTGQIKEVQASLATAATTLRQTAEATKDLPDKHRKAVKDAEAAVKAAEAEIKRIQADIQALRQRFVDAFGRLSGEIIAVFEKIGFDLPDYILPPLESVFRGIGEAVWEIFERGQLKDWKDVIPAVGQAFLKGLSGLLDPISLLAMAAQFAMHQLTQVEAALESAKSTAFEFAGTLKDAADTLISYVFEIWALVTQTRMYRRAQELLGKISEFLIEALWGFLWGIVAILEAIGIKIGAIEDPLEEVAEEFEDTARTLQELNVPRGFKQLAERMEWLVARPGEPYVPEPERRRPPRERPRPEFEIPEWIRNLITQFGDQIKAIAETLKKVIDIFAGFAREIAPIVLKAFLDILQILANALLAAAPHIVGALKQIIPAALEVAKVLTETLAKAFVQIAEWLNTTAAPIIAQILYKFAEFWKQHIDPFLTSQVLPFLLKVLTDILNFLNQKVLPDIMNVIWPSIRDKLWPLVEDFINFVVTEGKAFWDWLIANWKTVEEAFRLYLEGLKRDIQAGIDYIKVELLLKTGQFSEAWRTIWEGNFTIWQKLFLSLKVAFAWLEPVLARIIEIIIQVGGALLDLAAKIFAIPFKVLELAIQAIANGFNFLVSITSSVIRALGDFAGAVLKAIAEIFKLPLRVWNALMDFLSRIPVIGGIFAALKIPGLQEGGIVTAPTLAMLGERGPEMILPLPEFENLMRLSLEGPHVGGVELVNVIRVELDGRQVAQAIERVKIQDAILRGRY